MDVEVGCKMATVNTMNFQQARSFYEKLGYVCDFERQGIFKFSVLFFEKNIITQIILRFLKMKIAPDETENKLTNALNYLKTFLSKIYWVVYLFWFIHSRRIAEI